MWNGAERPEAVPQPFASLCPCCAETISAPGLRKALERSSSLAFHSFSTSLLLRSYALLCLASPLLRTSPEKIRRRRTPQASSALGHISIHFNTFQGISRHFMYLPCTFNIFPISFSDFTFQHSSARIMSQGHPAERWVASTSGALFILLGQLPNA